jgi:hypothetical protein
LIDPNKIFKRLVSENEQERITAVNMFFDSVRKFGDHPDDWEFRRKDPNASHANGDLHEAAAKMWEGLHEAAEADRKWAERRQKKAEAALKREQKKAQTEREAREKADAELAKLREQMKKDHAKAASGRSERVDVLSGLLSQDVVDMFSAEQIGERMQTLFSERNLRQCNATAQVDLVIGQLTEALYKRQTALFGKRKRGSNAPTVSEFLETHAGKSASWCRRCYKAYSIVSADGWDKGSWDRTGGIEGIIKSADDSNKPMVKRVNKVQQKLDALTDVVRRKQWENAEQMVHEWDR